MSPSKDDFASMSVKELRTLCIKRNLKGINWCSKRKKCIKTLLEMPQTPVPPKLQKGKKRKLETGNTTSRKKNKQQKATRTSSRLKQMQSNASVEEKEVDSVESPSDDKEAIPNQELDGTESMSYCRELISSHKVFEGIPKIGKKAKMIKKINEKIREYQTQKGEEEGKQSSDTKKKIDDVRRKEIETESSKSHPKQKEQKVQKRMLWTPSPKKTKKERKTSEDMKTKEEMIEICTQAVLTKLWNQRGRRNPWIQIDHIRFYLKKTKYQGITDDADWSAVCQKVDDNGWTTRNQILHRDCWKIMSVRELLNESILFD